MFNLEEALKGAPVVTKSGAAVLSIHCVDAPDDGAPVAAYVDKIGWLSYNRSGRRGTSEALDLKMKDTRYFSLQEALSGDYPVTTARGEKVLDLAYREDDEYRFPLAAFVEFKGWLTFTAGGTSSSGIPENNLLVNTTNKVG